jgi:hypothetical protein
MVTQNGVELYFRSENGCNIFFTPNLMLNRQAEEEEEFGVI